MTGIKAEAATRRSKLIATVASHDESEKKRGGYLKTEIQTIKLEAQRVVVGPRSSAQMLTIAHGGSRSMRREAVSETLLGGGAALTFVFATLSSAFAAPAQNSASPAVDPTIIPFTSTKYSARLPDGRTIHLVCMGKGSPVVILTAGGSGWSVSWAPLQARLAAKTMVCSWDPAGLGLSSPSAVPQTSDNLTSDLQAALKARGINGPYVMVGHSLGAYPSLLLADRWPSRVSAMVLIDPSIPDQAERFARLTPAQTAFMNALPNPVAFLEKCAAALRSGAVHAGNDPDRCQRAPDWPPDWPLAFRRALNKNFVGVPPAVTAAALDTLASNMKSTDLDTKIAVNPHRNYGTMPLIVLTASEFASPPDYPATAKAEIPVFEKEWRRGHDAYAALSTRGVNRIVPNSSHAMPDEKPEVVIDAVNEVVDQARKAAGNHKG